MSAVGGNDVTTLAAAAFHYRAPGRIPDFERAARDQRTHHGENSTRSEIQQSVHDRMPSFISESFSLVLLQCLPAGDRGADPSEENICP